MKTIFAFAVLFLTVAVYSQNSGSTGKVDFFEPGQLKINQGILQSHRIELKELSFQNDSASLESYTYVTVDGIKQLGEKMLLINWTTVTKFGTGLDICFIGQKDLSMRYRITPKGLPFGVLIESHAFDKEVNVIEANPDSRTHQEEISIVYPSVKQVYQKPSQQTKHQGHYNEISLPYLLASMDIKTGQEFVVPAYNPYSNKEYYYRISVKDKVKYTDLNGRKHKVYEVEGRSQPTLDEATNLTANSIGQSSTYYVSDRAPYFFGKSWFQVTEDGIKTETKRWILSNWQLNSVNPNLKKDELIEEWQKIKKAQGIVIPWGSGK